MSRTKFKETDQYSSGQISTIVTPVIAPRERPVANVTGSFQFILQLTVEVAIHEASRVVHACSMTTAALVRPRFKTQRLGRNQAISMTGDL
jgi:hypothetical protein